jgi:hypothetical protein
VTVRHGTITGGPELVHPQECVLHGYVPTDAASPDPTPVGPVNHVTYDSTPNELASERSLFQFSVPMPAIRRVFPICNALAKEVF